MYCARKCAKCFIYIISLNPSGDLGDSYYYCIRDEENEGPINSPRITQLVIGKTRIQNRVNQTLQASQAKAIPHSQSQTLLACPTHSLPASAYLQRYRKTIVTMTLRMILGVPNGCITFNIQVTSYTFYHTDLLSIYTKENKHCTVKLPSNWFRETK